jgi:hypothetical protein
MNSAGTEATLGDTHKTQNEQCRDTGNIGRHTQDTEWTVQGHRQHWAAHTGHRMDSAGTQATLGGTHKTQNGQCRDTGNIGRHTQDNRMDSAGTQATLGDTHKTTEWTVQEHRQHWVAHTRQQNGQCRDTGNIGRHTQDTE